MKKFLLIISSVLLLSAVFVSCNKNSPKEVANTWLNSFWHMDYEAAKKVSTEDTKNLLSQLQQLSSMVPDSNKKELKKITINIKDVKEDGDNATVTYTTSNSADKVETLKLVKQSNKWLVVFSKNDQMGGGAGDAGSEQPGGAADSAAASADANAVDSTKH